MTTTRLLLVLLALALPGALVSGCGSGGDDEPATATPAATPAAAAIQRDEANAKVSLTIGSKNFTEQRVLGEIYAQGLRAAGYDVQTKLDLGDEHVALKALESGEIDAYPEYTGTALQSFFGKQPDELPKDPQAAYERGQAGLRQARAGRVPADAVHLLQRGRGHQGDRRQARAAEDLRPQGPGAGPHARRLAGVPRAARLPARPRDGLRPEVRPLHAPSRSPSATRYSPPGKPTSRSCSPPIRRSSASPRCCWRTIESMFGPYNSTLVMRKETAERAGPDLPRDAGADPGPADRREHAGAERESRSGRPGAGRRRQGLPDGERPARRAAEAARSRSGCR